MRTPGSDEARERAAAMLDRLGIPNAARQTRRLPAPVLRRDAATGHAGVGAGDEPEALGRRRADDGARRHDPGPNPRSDRRSPPRDGAQRHPDHPQSGRGQRGSGSRCGHVRRRDRRDRYVARIFNDPQHPYTQGLLKSMPYLHERRQALYVIPGRVPELSAMPKACRFAARCPNRIAQCTDVHPDLQETDRTHAPSLLQPHRVHPLSRWSRYAA